MCIRDSNIVFYSGSEESDLLTRFAKECSVGIKAKQVKQAHAIANDLLSMPLDTLGQYRIPLEECIAFVKLLDWISTYESDSIESAFQFQKQLESKIRRVEKTIKL